MKSIFLLVLWLFLIVSCSTWWEIQTSVIQEGNLNIVQPDRKTDIYGKISSMEWNEITLLQVDTSKDPTFSMTSEEKQKYMRSLDESARTTLKEEINNSTMWEVKLTIPVWIPMTKKETSWPDSPTIEASIADLKVWQFISIWLNNQVNDQKIAEFVKIAFTQ